MKQSCFQPHPRGKSLPTHASTGDPSTPAGSSGSVSCGATAPFLSLGVQGFVCTLQDWSLCFSPYCGRLLIKSHWPSRSDSLEIPSHFVGSLGWEAWYGAQNLHSSGRTSSILLFSSLWITQLVGMGFEFIVIVPLLPSCYGFFFVIRHRVSFFGGFQCPHVNDCSTDRSNSGALARGDEHTFFCSAILNWKSCVYSS